MKRMIIITLMSLVAMKLIAQTGANTDFIKWQTKVEDEWFDSHVDSMLKIGDKTPNFPLGVVINNYTRKTKISDFIGKLVILDFWDTKCTDCIAGFPKMEKLQYEFGDRIQIILVNLNETQEEIDNAFKDNKIKPSLKLPNLPCIVGPRKDLSALFPTRGIPHHVWIDKNGIIRIVGPSINTYAEKIEDLLNGKKVSCVFGINNTPKFNKEIPYFSLINKTIDPTEYNSFFSPYNPVYQGCWGGYVENTIDSITRTVRNTYVNVELLDLYHAVFRDYLKKSTINTFWSKYNLSSSAWLDYCLLFVSDTLRYTNAFKFLNRQLEVSDKDYVKSIVCYEQITPISWSREKRKQHMLDDINRFVDSHYGGGGAIEKRMVSCYRLVRTSNQDKLSSKSEKVSQKKYIENGKKVVLFNHATLKYVIGYCISHQQEEFKGLIFNDTGYSNNIDIILPDPSEFKSLDDLVNALRLYDLNIVKEERELQFVVIRER